MWNDENEAELRRLWKTGKSASQIAAALGWPTRSAVIGKAHRLKLPGRPSPITHGYTPERALTPEMVAFCRKQPNADLALVGLANEFKVNVSRSTIVRARRGIKAQQRKLAKAQIEWVRERWKEGERTSIVGALKTEFGIDVSFRTVQRACNPHPATRRYRSPGVYAIPDVPPVFPTCQWPQVAPDDPVSCPEKALGGHPYCQAHCERAYRREAA